MNDRTATSDSFETITFATDGAVASLHLDRPSKRNAVNTKMIHEIGAVFGEPPKDVAAIVIAGRGSSFCAGLDLSEHAERDAREAMDASRLWHRVTDLIQHGGLPVVAALTGHVIGAGLEIAASTHIRVAEEDALFALPEGRRGIFVGGGASVRVSRLIGEGRLLEMMLTGRTIDAQEALRIGLVHHVVPVGSAYAKACEIAATVAENAPLSNLMMLGALPRIAEMGPAEGLFTESLAVALTQTSPEAKERMRAFLDRGRGNAPRQA